MKIALITGASSGLGVAFAREVCRDPSYEQIWLVARREDRLCALAAEDARLRPVPLDLTDPDAAARLAEQLEAQHAELSLLVNNAGRGTYGNFDTLPVESQTTMTELNVTALTRVTGVCLPFMKRGDGILNVSSIASFAPNPGMSVYSATKAYVSAFSRGLREELKPRGIHVLFVCPGPMDTEFLDVAQIRGRSKAFDTLPYCDPAKVVQGALKRLRKGKAIYVNRPFYKLYRLVAKLLPKALVLKFART